MPSIAHDGDRVAGRQLHTSSPPKCQVPSVSHGKSDCGFVVWLARSGSRTRGFLAWAETAVAELSPFHVDAWRYPSTNAAHDAVSRAFGPAAETYCVAIFPSGL